MFNTFLSSLKIKEDTLIQIQYGGIQLDVYLFIPINKQQLANIQIPQRYQLKYLKIFHAAQLLKVRHFKIKP